MRILRPAPISSGHARSEEVEEETTRETVHPSLSTCHPCFLGPFGQLLWSQRALTPIFSSCLPAFSYHVAQRSSLLNQATLCPPNSFFCRGASHSASPLLCGVHHVVTIGSNRKVVRVYARASVALVQNDHSVWNFPNVRDVRDAMSQSHLAIHVNLPVASVCDRSSPKTAPSIGFWNR